MTTLEPRWIGLTRVSSVGQAEDGGGLQTQQAAIRAWVESRGDTLVCFETDTVGGTLDKMAQRVGLASALQRMNNGQAEGIVVARLDRLGRELALQEIVLAQVRKLGCRLASVDPTEQEMIENDTDPGRRMFRQILAVFADYERMMIIARTQAGKKRKQAEGGWLGSTPPYGFEMDGHGGIRELPYEMAAIGVARTMRRMGASYRNIGGYLGDSGVRLRKAEKWHPEMVKRIVNRAELYDNPKPAELDNLAKLYMGLPGDAKAV